MEEKTMKKWVVIGMIGLFMAGCGTAAKESEFWQHSTMYRSGDHLKYSWGGYMPTTPDEVQESTAQQWWGIPEAGK